MVATSTQEIAFEGSNIRIAFWQLECTHLVEIGCKRVGDAAVYGDFVGHAGVAADGEVLD